MNIGTIQGDVKNIVEGTQNNAAALDNAIRRAPIYDRQELRMLFQELKDAIESKEPDDMTVKELFGKIGVISKDVAEVAWETWKNPLKGLGVLWEKMTDEDSDK